MARCHPARSRAHVCCRRPTADAGARARPSRLRARLCLRPRVPLLFPRVPLPSSALLLPCPLACMRRLGCPCAPGQQNPNPGPSARGARGAPQSRSRPSLARAARQHRPPQTPALAPTGPVRPRQHAPLLTRPVVDPTHAAGPTSAQAPVVFSRCCLALRQPRTRYAAPGATSSSSHTLPAQPPAPTRRVPPAPQPPRRGRAGPRVLQSCPPLFWGRRALLPGLRRGARGFTYIPQLPVTIEACTEHCAADRCVYIHTPQKEPGQPTGQVQQSAAAAAGRPAASEGSGAGPGQGAAADLVRGARPPGAGMPRPPSNSTPRPPEA